MIETMYLFHEKINKNLESSTIVKDFYYQKCKIDLLIIRFGIFLYNLSKFEKI